MVKPPTCHVLSHIARSRRRGRRRAHVTIAVLKQSKVSSFVIQLSGEEFEIGLSVIENETMMGGEDRDERWK